MKFSQILLTLGLFFFFRPAFSAEAVTTTAPAVKPIVIRLHLSSDEKIRKDLGYYLKGELELIEGVTVTESQTLPADYELEVMEVNEPLGRMVLSATFSRPFNQKDNITAYKKLMVDHWKGGMKDAEWEAFAEYFKPYGVIVSRQLLTGRKSKVRDLCTSLAGAFSKDVLKRPVQAEATSGK